MEIAVDVGEAAEVPDEVGAFDLPGVPDFVGGDVVFAAVAGDEEARYEVFVLDGLHGGGDVVGAEADEHAAHGFEELGLLVFGEIGAAEAGEVGLAFFDDFGGAFVAGFAADEDFFLLLAVEGLDEFIEDEALIPEGVAFVVFGLVEGFGEVAVEDGATAEAEALIGVGVAAACDVVAGVDELEVGVGGGAEEADGGGVFDFAHEVLLDLPVHFFAVVGMMKGLEDLPDEVLLIFGVEGVEALLGADVPPVADEAALGVVEREDDLGMLLFGEAFVELGGEGVFGGWRGGGAK